jgi:hypothetical protein
LRTWGPVVLDRPIEVTPRDSLSYWCETQCRLRRIAEQYPSNLLLIGFEQLCLDPIGVSRSILDFTDCDLPEATLAEFAQFVKIPKSIGRYKSSDLSVFRSTDLEKLVGEGYRIEG